MKKLLLKIIEDNFNYPIFLHGTLLMGTPYPDNFFTFWNNNTYDRAFYDDENTETVWNFDLNFYSNNPTTVNETMKTIKALFKQNGFIVRGEGFDMPSDVKTHTGRGINLIIVDRQTNNKYF